jgi:hypothetical protein
MKDHAIAASGELAEALRRRNGYVVVSPPMARHNESIEAEVLDLDAIRPALFLVVNHHRNRAAMNGGACPGCPWCNLPQEWRDWAEQTRSLALGDWLTVSSAGDQAQVIAIDGDNLTLRHPGGTTSVYDIAEFDGRILTALERSTTPSDSEEPPSPSPGTETPDGP